MVRKGFPKISGPIPISHQEPEPVYEDVPPLQTVSAFERYSVSVKDKWFKILWNGKFTRESAISPLPTGMAQSVPITPSVPKIPSALSLSESTINLGSSQHPDNISEELVKDTLLQASDLEELDFWTKRLVVSSDLLWEAVDCILFKVNPPAWETLTYLFEKDIKIEKVRSLYLERQNDIIILGSSLKACQIEDHRMSLALWRIWAYCILSVDSTINGNCIAIQTAWLRGPTVNRATLGKPRLDDHKNENWKLCCTNGIFAQSNKDLQQSDVDNMIQIWDLLKKKWLSVITGTLGDKEGVDRCIMLLFSRISGPRDIFNILEGSHLSYFSFHSAFRTTLSSRSYEAPNKMLLPGHPYI